MIGRVLLPGRYCQLYIFSKSYFLRIARHYGQHAHDEGVQFGHAVALKLKLS